MFYPNSLGTTWGPRVGFAYQLPERWKMTVRGGYGIFYSPRIPNGWSGVPWGNKIGLHGDEHREPALAEHGGVQLGQRLQRRGEAGDARSLMAAQPSGAR